MNEKEAVQSAISHLYGSAQEIRNSMGVVRNGEALTELTQALLLVDGSTRQCRIALADLDDHYESDGYTIEPHE
ncbi:MAG: hypothetical protein ACOX5W_10540 [Bacillota bacterium]